MQMHFIHKFCAPPKGVKISVVYRYIGDWNEQKIGIGKCKNMHIGATLYSILWLHILLYALYSINSVQVVNGNNKVL